MAKTLTKCLFLENIAFGPIRAHNLKIGVQREVAFKGVESGSKASG